MTKWRSFEEARKFVRSLNLEGTNNQKVWREYCTSGNKPDDIPAAPEKAYKKEWKGIENWMRKNSNRNSLFNRLDFKQARKYVHTLKITSVREWEKICRDGKLPKNIPVLPRTVYKDEWIGWLDWLGTKKIIERNRDYLPFKQARKYVHSLKLKSRKDWQELSKKKKLPANIPFHPERIYKEFVSMGDWLGSGTQSSRIISENYLPWKEAKPIYQKLAKKYQLSGRMEDWIEFARTHKELLKKLNISATPWNSYSKKRELKRSMKDD